MLSLKDNPEQQWVDLRQAVMDRLKGENEALLRRLRELEEGGVRAGGKEREGEGELVPRESWELVNKEKTELEEVVKQKEKRLLRLQQVRSCRLSPFRIEWFSLFLAYAGLPIQKCRVPRSDSVNSRA